MLFCAVMLTACGSPVDKLEALVEETEENYKDYTSEDWKDKAAEFKEISEALEKEELSKEEKQKCAELIKRYGVVAAKGSANMLKGIGDLFK